jgi:hypothetical protein
VYEYILSSSCASNPIGLQDSFPFVRLLFVLRAQRLAEVTGKETNIKEGDRHALLIIAVSCFF